MWSDPELPAVNFAVFSSLDKFDRPMGEGGDSCAELSEETPKLSEETPKNDNPTVTGMILP